MTSRINIGKNDTIRATILRHGMTIANLSISGVNSLSAAINKILSSLGRTPGLITIVLRNTTQGWTQRHSVSMASAPMQAKAYASALQLSLF